MAGGERAMRIAVTGASGFIGGAVVAHLVAAGHDVVGFGRRERPRSLPDAATYARWDLTAGPAPSSGSGVVGGFDAVVHAAGLADDGAAPAQLRAVNVAGTRAALTLTPRGRFVHISSSSVYDLAVASVRVREEAGPAARPFGAYAASKAAAERLLARAVGSEGRDVVVLRPHAVHGPGDTTLLPRLLAAARLPVLPLPDGGRVPHQLTHVANLAHAVELALTGPVGTYNVTDPAPVLIGDAIRTVAAAHGVTARLVSVPFGVLDVVARLGEAGARWGRPARLTRYAVAQLGRERTYDLTAARDRLGYDPAPTSL